MKRDIAQLLDNQLGPLAVDEVHALCEEYRRQLAEHFSAKAWPYTKRFFELGEEPFRRYVLDALARGEDFQFINRLRGVCRQWHLWIQQLTHLRFSARDWVSPVYDIVLTDWFPRVVSLHAPWSILDRRADAFSRITSLDIKEVVNSDRIYDIDISQWCGLVELVVPSCNFELTGLASLTRLTRLDVLGQAFGDTLDTHTQLLQLTGLRDLRVRCVTPHVDIAQLTALVRLNSDQPRHFSRYTGTGFLWSHIDELTEIFEDYEDGDAFDQLVGDMRADLSLIAEGAVSVRLEGQWVHGVFTGDSSIRTKETSFNGNFVNGVREGHGYEYDINYRRLSFGEWHLGRRHGWCLVGCRDEALTRTDATAIEKWSHGILVSQWEIMTASRIKEAVADGHAAIRITHDDCEPFKLSIEYNVSVADDASDSTHIGEGVWYAIKK